MDKASKFLRKIESLRKIDWKKENVQKKATAIAFGAVGVGLCLWLWRSKPSADATAASAAKKPSKVLTKDKRPAKSSQDKRPAKSYKKKQKGEFLKKQISTSNRSEGADKATSNTPENPKKKSSASAEAGASIAITKKRLISIFDEISQRMRVIMQRLSVEEAKVREDALMKNMLVDEKALQQGLLHQFWESMNDVELEVYARQGTCEEAVTIAAEKFVEDPDFKKSMRNLRQLYANMSKSPEQYPDVPSHLTKERVMTIMDSMMKRLTGVMEKICEEVKKNNECRSKEELLALLNGPLGPRVRAGIMHTYTRRMKQIQRDLREEHGIDEQEVLQAAMISFQNEDDFRAHTLRLTQEQEKRFQQLGFSDAAVPNNA